MNFSFACVGLVVASSLVAVAGCSADATNAEEAAASQDELTSSSARLVGAFHGAGGSVRPPTFDGLVFQESGDFFADVDTGIRCVTAPCPSHVRIAGRFTATRTFVTLSPADGAGALENERAAEFYGRYRYTLEGDKLSFTRSGAAWDSWTNELTKETSYCAQPTDCGSQRLITPACVGHWTCGEQRACGWSCGIALPTVWPADRQALVAQTAGGGFTPPPPPGSECAVGAQKYTLDIASRNLAWEVCSFQDWSTPMHLERGSRTLTQAELATIDAAMNDVTISTQEICGADKPFLSISVKSAARGEQKYVDSFYSCRGNDTYVDNIDGVFSAFRALAH